MASLWAPFHTVQVLVSPGSRLTVQNRVESLIRIHTTHSVSSPDRSPLSLNFLILLWPDHILLKSSNRFKYWSLRETSWFLPDHQDTALSKFLHSGEENDFLSQDPFPLWEKKLDFPLGQHLSKTPHIVCTVWVEPTSCVSVFPLIWSWAHWNS